MSDEQWTRDLAAAARGVRPDADAVGPVLREVRRRRARRRMAGVVGAAALAVAAVVLTPTVVGLSRPGGPGPSGTQGSVFSCPTEPDADREAAVATFAEHADQESAILRMRQGVERRFAGARTTWRVAHAEATVLGPVVLVGGDAPDDVADLLEDLAGRDLLVAGWSPEDVAVGLDREAMVQQVLQWQLEPVVADVRRAVRGREGSGELEVRPEAGVVVLRWKAPVPGAVADLAGVRPNGVEVLVEPVRYSGRDVRLAGDRAIEHLEDTGRAWSSMVPCLDGSGLVAGLVPPIEDEVADELADVVGMPVMVVPEEQGVLDRSGDG